MNPFDQFTVGPIDHQYHLGESGFREQMAVLHLAGSCGDQFKFIRSFLTVCQPGVAGFDPQHPGENTTEGWKVLDNLIENGNVRGTFHTHPPGVVDFSDHDWLSMIGIAKANGMRPIYHGVQAADQQTAHFVCLQSIRGQVHIYDFGFLDVDINDPVILLPAPPDVQQHGDMTIFRMGDVWLDK